MCRHGPELHGRGHGHDAITVYDVPPSNLQVSLTAASINENGSTALSGSFTDPGTLDTHTVLVDWGAHRQPTRRQHGQSRGRRFELWRHQPSIPNNPATAPFRLSDM